MFFRLSENLEEQISNPVIALARDVGDLLTAKDAYTRNTLGAIFSRCIAYRWNYLLIQRSLLSGLGNAIYCAKRVSAMVRQTLKLKSRSGFLTERPRRRSRTTNPRTRFVQGKYR